MLGLCCGAGFSLAESQGYSPVAVCRLLPAVASFVEGMGSRACGLQQLQLPDSRAQAQ